MYDAKNMALYRFCYGRTLEDVPPTGEFQKCLKHHFGGSLEDKLV